MHARASFFALTFVAVGLISADAFAQTIRTYGDKAETSYGAPQQSGTRTTFTPGAPAPPPPQAKPADPGEAGTDKKGDAKEDTGSYVTVFKSGSFSQKPVEELDLAETEMYRGIIPGKRDSVKHLTNDDGSDNRITWIGFQSKDSSSRVFFQTVRAADYEIVSGDASNMLVVRFSDTKIPVRNFKRFIDTSAFNWNVRRIEAKQASRGVVEVTIKLESDEEPIISRNGGYLYLDFKKKVEKDTTGDS